jgi:hypothetical protein
VKVPGTHKDFVFTSREQVVSAMQRFLGGTKATASRASAKPEVVSALWRIARSTTCWDISD